MRLTVLRWLALVVLITSVAACDHNDSKNSSPTSPTQAVNLTGSWSGDVTVEGTPARMTWTLSQVIGSTTVIGTVLVALPSGIVVLNGGLSGTFDGTSLTYVIAVGLGGVPSQPSCVGQLNGTVVFTAGAPSTLKGNVAVMSTSCTSPLQATSFTLAKI
jgi:hypothetical protein